MTAKALEFSSFTRTSAPVPGNGGNVANTEIILSRSRIRICPGVAA